MKPFLMSSPLTLMLTAYPEDRISVAWLVRMNIKPTNILWGYEGMYFLCPVQHVVTKMRLYKDRANKKAACSPEFYIEKGDCMPLDWKIGKQLTRRAKV